jgi:glycerophosphoryl diester phosphodiesterase
MRIVSAILFFSAVVSTSGSVIAQDQRNYLTVAHRGVVTDTLTENSLPSLEETIRRGYTHIEVDLRSTKDGQVVCLHDSSLRRTTSIRKHIHEVTLAELRKLVAEETVPSFAAFAKRCAGRIELMPDIKKVPEDLKDAFYDGINATMTKYDLLEHALFIGDKTVADRFKGRARVSWRQPVDEMHFEGAEATDPGRYYFVFGHAVDFTPESIRAYQEQGLQVVVSINTFHYRKAEAMERGLRDVKTMLEWGADGVQIDSVYEPALP